MDDKINSLKEKLENIYKYGWVKSMANGKGAIGITLEKLLNINSGNFEVPDYELSIELKTKASYFNNIHPLTLFSATCDGENLFELRRIKDKFGIYLKAYNSRILFANLRGNQYTNISKNYRVRLFVNYFEKRINLIIYNKNNIIVDNNAYWSFDLLYNKLYKKLKVLAFIEADRKIVNNELYFKYNNVTIYKLKSFNTFLELLNNGIIRINIKIGIYKSGPRVGQTHDHGTGFQILYSDLEKLFIKI